MTATATDRVLHEKERTGKSFISQHTALRARLDAAKLDAERARHLFPEDGGQSLVAGRHFDTDVIATIATNTAVATWRRPKVETAIARVNAIELELQALGEARARECRTIDHRAVLGGDVVAPVVQLPDWRTTEYRALVQQLDNQAAELSQLDGLLVDLEAGRAAAQTAARTAAVSLRLGEIKRSVADRAQQTIVEADAALVREREQRDVIEDAVSRLEAKRSDMEATLRAQAEAAYVAALKASAAAVAKHLRAAMGEHMTFTALYEAICGPNGENGNGVYKLVDLDVTNADGSARRWIESLQARGWIS